MDQSRWTDEFVPPPDRKTAKERGGPDQVNCSSIETSDHTDQAGRSEGLLEPASPKLPRSIWRRTNRAPLLTVSPTMTLVELQLCTGRPGDHLQRVSHHVGGQSTGRVADGHAETVTRQSRRPSPE